MNQTMLKGAKAYRGQQVLDRNALVEKYALLVKRIALHIKGRLPAYVDPDDLIQSGMLGLIDAVQNFKDGHGAVFETYAAIRIRGAIIDQLRRSDWTPRVVHQNARTLNEAKTRLSHEFGREPTAEEVAEDLGVDIERYHAMVLEANGSKVIGIEDTGLTEDVISDAPLSETIGNGNAVDELYSVIDEQQFKVHLARAIEDLPERERVVVAFYYQKEMNLREIGLILNISESRTCQILATGLSHLRAKLSEWDKKADNQGPFCRSAEDVYLEHARPDTSHKEKYKSTLFDESGEITFQTETGRRLDAERIAKKEEEERKAASIRAANKARRPESGSLISVRTKTADYDPNNPQRPPKKKTLKKGELDTNTIRAHATRKSSAKSKADDDGYDLDDEQYLWEL